MKEFKSSSKFNTKNLVLLLYWVRLLKELNSLLSNCHHIIQETVWSVCVAWRRGGACLDLMLAFLSGGSI